MEVRPRPSTRSCAASTVASRSAARQARAAQGAAHAVEDQVGEAARGVPPGGAHHGTVQVYRPRHPSLVPDRRPGVNIGVERDARPAPVRSVRRGSACGLARGEDPSWPSRSSAVVTSEGTVPRARSAAVAPSPGATPSAGYVERRERLLAAAAEVFKDKGLEATSINDIAERMGVGPGLGVLLLRQQAGDLPRAGPAGGRGDRAAGLGGHRGVGRPARRAARAAGPVPAGGLRAALPVSFSCTSRRT